jgi:hypothetical protein
VTILKVNRPVDVGRPLPSKTLPPTPLLINFNLKMKIRK